MTEELAVFPVLLAPGDTGQARLVMKCPCKGTSQHRDWWDLPQRHGLGHHQQEAHPHTAGGLAQEASRHAEPARCQS